VNCNTCHRPAPRVSTAPDGRYARRTHRGITICHACFIDLMDGIGSAEVERRFDAAVDAVLGPPPGATP
jgi:hypothetical protein